MTSLFDDVVPSASLSRAKWEMEIARVGNPDLLCFGTADMDFRSPPPVIDALRCVLDVGHLGYPYKDDAYHAAIVDHFERRFGWSVDPAWLASNVGIYPSIQTLIEQLTEPGDEIVFQTPVHHIFREIVAANGRVPLENPLVVDEGGRYRMDLAGLERLVGERTTMFLLCNPHNPVGRAWTHDELSELSRFCADRNIRVVADEVYFGLVHDGARFTPMAGVSDESSMNTVTVTSASKSFNLTGLKHSLVIAQNTELLAAYQAGLVRSNLFFGGSTMGIVATRVALDQCDDWSRDLMGHIAANLLLVREVLAQKLPELKLTEPESTYFAWIDCRAWGLDDAELIAFFEKDAQIIVTHGSVLGTGGSGHVRFNLACSTRTLTEGLDRMVTARTTSPGSARSC